jgi:HEPN domain-containing protein
MTEASKEWLKKARRDFATMNREVRAEEEPNYEAVCFHAQQCVEKMLKGYLIEHFIVFGKTHDLRELLNLAGAIQPGWKIFDKQAARLSEYAVDTRYPGAEVYKEDAEEAVITCKKIRGAILAELKETDQLSL